MFLNASGWMELRCFDFVKILKETYFSQILININDWFAITGFHRCYYPASYTYISLSSGRSEKAKAPIFLRAAFLDIKLRETHEHEIYFKKSCGLLFIHTHSLESFFVSATPRMLNFSTIWVIFLRGRSSSCSITKTKHKHVG